MSLRLLICISLAVMVNFSFAGARKLKLAKVPSIGQKLDIKPSRNPTLLLINSSQFYPKVDVLINNITYTIAYDNNHIIKYISTSDSKFETPEYVKTGDPLSQFKKQTESEPLTERGWAFFIHLKSGWYAAFTQGPTMTEGDLSLDAKVQWLFKR